MACESMSGGVRVTGGVHDDRVVYMMTGGVHDVRWCT